MLYFSISVLINTCFFPTIQRYMMDDLQVLAKVDSSLLEVMLENLLGFENDAVSLAADADDVSVAVDYLLPRAGVSLSRYEALNMKARMQNYDCPACPVLKRSTPPPKAE